MPMEDLLTRQAPHSQEAEQSVLGSMLIDSRCISDVVGVVRPEDFYLQAEPRDLRDDVRDVQLFGGHRPGHRAR